jgi:hypothetical protein
MPTLQILTGCTIIALLWGCGRSPNPGTASDKGTVYDLAESDRAADDADLTASVATATFHVTDMGTRLNLL